MKRLIRYFICLGLIVPGCSSLLAQVSQEICDNGQDDDGDGKIDLFDADCHCHAPTPSLIPNPSFEDTLCCSADLECVVIWEQASEGTTDFYHSCRTPVPGEVDIPMPLPDGEGCIGFLNGLPGPTLGQSTPSYKEYAGACLSSPMLPGVSYTFQVSLGHIDADNSPSLNLSFFGTETCDNLPFAGEGGIGCPLDGPGWVKLGATYSQGNPGWEQIAITVIPDQKISAIAIGPDCIRQPSTQTAYYLLDNLQLQTSSSFPANIEPSAHPCAPNFGLSVASYPDISYQWYKDSLALVGEISPGLGRLYGRGTYQVLTTNSDGICRLSASFLYDPPETTAQIDTTICREDRFWFGGQLLDQAGQYVDTFRTADHCDSIVLLNVAFFEYQPAIQEVKIWPGEQVIIGPARLSEPGWHEIDMVSRSGCDSSFIIDLTFFQFFAPTAFSPNGDGINDRFFIAGGVDVAELNFQIFDRWGRMVYSGSGQAPGLGWDGNVRQQPAPEGVYMYRANVRFIDGKTRVQSGSITLLR